MNKNGSTVSNREMANAIRALAMDAVQHANSGHPGMPMGMADVATVLYRKFLKFNPKNPKWPDRDRFVLSAGHGSMLLYALLHLTGYDRPTMDDIKKFRQLHHPCAGHPEYGLLDGVETTTGPLGQGLATAVGMCLGERLLNTQFGDDIVDHYTYVIAGDGCLMEGISHEAISFAGHMKLGKLIVLWDDNDISIDGPLNLTCSDDQLKRFEASGWHVAAIDGHDEIQIENAIAKAKKDPRPSMIACKTTIGFGAPTKQGTASTHGAPLGEEEIVGTRKALGWDSPAFEIPRHVSDAWKDVATHSAAEFNAWTQRFEQMDAEERDIFNNAIHQTIPSNLSSELAKLKNHYIAEPKKVATRKASELVLNVINDICPITVGGSADLTGSNNTKTSTLGVIKAPDYDGRYIYYGVREFGMSAIMNGLSLHGGFIPYGGTFLVFTDYARSAIRLSALMKQGVIYVMTHDSIGLGEDGPTHQPVEHIASLRAMPGVNVFRPCDVIETAECWEIAMQNRHTPSVIALSRQGLEQCRLSASIDNLSAKGGYVISAAKTKAYATLIATGSEVSAAIAAQKILETKGISANVVSMPCTELFDQLSAKEQTDILGGDDLLKVSIEAGTTYGWDRYVGRNGIKIGIDSFGESAPAPDLFDHFGFTAEKIAKRVLEHF